MAMDTLPTAGLPAQAEMRVTVTVWAVQTMTSGRGR